VGYDSLPFQKRYATQSIQQLQEPNSVTSTMQAATSTEKERQV